MGKVPGTVVDHDIRLDRPLAPANTDLSPADEGQLLHDPVELILSELGNSIAAETRYSSNFRLICSTTSHASGISSRSRTPPGVFRNR